MPRLQVLASRHPASTVRVITFWRHDVEMVPKLPVLAPRHLANTDRVVTFGVAKNPTKQNGAETTSLGATMRPRSPRPPANTERDLRSKMVPKLLVLALRHARDHRQHQKGHRLCIEIVPKPERERKPVAPRQRAGSAMVVSFALLSALKLIKSKEKCDDVVTQC